MPQDDRKPAWIDPTEEQLETMLRPKEVLTPKELSEVLAEATNTTVDNIEKEVSYES